MIKTFTFENFSPRMSAQPPGLAVLGLEILLFLVLARIETMSLSTQLSTSVKEGKKDDACAISSVVTAQDPCRNGVEPSDSGWIGTPFSPGD